MITHKIKSIVLASLILCIVLYAGIAYANPAFIASRAVSATATTTVTYLTAGNTTTTSPIYDSYEAFGTNQTNQGNISLPNSVAILLQGTASSTATTVTVTCEFSEDLQDWYQNNINPGTTTPAISLAFPTTYSYTYAAATSLIGGNVLATSTNRFTKLFTCPVPLRYVRLIVTNTGSSTAIWTAIVPNKQRN